MKGKLFNLANLEQLSCFKDEFKILNEMIKEYDSDDRGMVEAICLATSANICMRVVEDIHNAEEYKVTDLFNSLIKALEVEASQVSEGKKVADKYYQIKELEREVTEKLESVVK